MRKPKLWAVIWTWAGHFSLAHWLISGATSVVMGGWTWIDGQPFWLVAFVTLGSAAIVLIILHRLSSRIAATSPPEPEARHQLGPDAVATGKPPSDLRMAEGSVAAFPDGDGRMNYLRDTAVGRGSTVEGGGTALGKGAKVRTSMQSED